MYNQIISVHCNGNRFGGIGRALLITDDESVFELWYDILGKRSRMSWGQIRKEYGVYDLASGRVISKGEKQGRKQYK